MTARLIAVTLDCPNIDEMVDFYVALTGGEVLYRGEEAAYVGTDSLRIGLQKVENHRRPSWPDDDKQFHLDFSVENPDEAEEQVLAAGAVKPDFQPGGDKWRVYQDPAGHPFCLTSYAG